MKYSMKCDKREWKIKKSIELIVNNTENSMKILIESQCWSGIEEFVWDENTVVWRQCKIVEGKQTQC